MEDWELDFEWLKVRHFVKDTLRSDALPDLNTVLFLIGIQELGQLRDKYTKEEKQDLMHIAVCRLMSQDGVYEFVGLDDDGWPHWKQVKTIEKKGEKEQEGYLKTLSVKYFSSIIKSED